MSNGLGLSVGETNLAVAPAGGTALTTRSILTVFPDRAPEVGVTGGIPTPGGLVLTGFVERVGDTRPLVAADGSAHTGETVLAEALDALVQANGNEAPTAVAVPAHWGLQAVSALRGALRGRPALAGAALIPDSTAALAGLRAAAELPDHGVIALCDFGGSGTSISLADADAADALIGPAVRCSELSGDALDQAVLSQVIAGLSETGADPAGTAAVGSLSALRDECRRAKEALSTDDRTEVQANLPGFTSAVTLTRTELEALIDPPLTTVLTALAESLQRNNIAAERVSAVATVGGGAAIPLVARRLAEYLGVPVVTSPTPALMAAVGSTLVDPQALAGDAPTGMAPTLGWAAATTLPDALPPNQSAATSSIGALAWSDDDAAGDPAASYATDEYPAASSSAPTTSADSIDFADFDDLDSGDDHRATPIPPWYRRPSLLFGAAAAAFLAAGGGLAVTLTSNDTPSGPVTENVTVTRTASNGAIETTVVPATKHTVTQSADNGQVITTVVPQPINPEPEVPPAPVEPTQVAPIPIPLPIPMPYPRPPRPWPHPTTTEPSWTRPHPTRTTSTATPTTTSAAPTTTTGPSTAPTTTDAPTTTHQQPTTRPHPTHADGPTETADTPATP